MDRIEARILLKNLLHRVKVLDDGTKQLAGVLTDDELDALRIALDHLNGESSPTPSLQLRPEAPSGESDDKVEAPTAELGTDGVEVGPATEIADGDPRDDAKIKSESISLNLGTLELPEPPAHVRFCLDFGTAMSKATLIRDLPDGTEEIHVLSLGVPGDQEEISETLLISSVYIDDSGRLWFGKAAVDRSLVEGDDGSRQRLDNIKRRLSEEGWDEPVDKKANPTNVEITHGDMVIAYLAFLTWAATRCVEQLGYPSNLPRRFAMPCLAGAKGRETIHRLKCAMGEAQVLADTFGDSLQEGVPLNRFVGALRQLRRAPHSYPYVAEDITEPLGVAGSIISWGQKVDSLIMVVDIGAGTSDLSLYRVHIDPTNGKNTAIEVEGSARGLTEAGNHLDRMLIELIIRKSGITSEDPVWVNVRSALELQIRDLKETLFNDGFVFVPLMNGAEIEVELEEFLDLPAVRRFGDSLRETMVDILEKIDSSWVNWVTAHPARRLAIALTGGGAELPMVKSLAEGEIGINGTRVPVHPAVRFPGWLRDIDESLEDDYARIAVSLGGARRRLIARGNQARVTAGDVTDSPRLEGYYTKGV